VRKGRDHRFSPACGIRMTSTGHAPDGTSATWPKACLSLG